MEPVTVSIEEEHADLLDELSGDGGPCTNRSEAMRLIIDGYNDINEFKSEIEELHQEVDRLNRERRQLLEQREENQELMTYVEDEKRYRHAGLFQRFRWWFRGMD